MFGTSSQAQQTQRKYLSGIDKDHTNTWQFYCTGGRNSANWSTIQVPSQWELQGFGTYSYGLAKKRSDEKGIYKHKFTVPGSWKDKSVEVVFQGVMTDAEVEINGKSAGPVHQGAFYKFSYDISRLLRYGHENEIKITVSKESSNESVNRAERHADYWVFGGIFRPVYLQAKPRQHIKRVAIDAKADGYFTAHVYTEGEGKAKIVMAQIKTLDGKNVGSSFQTLIDSTSNYQALTAKIVNPKQWSPEFPNLYRVIFYLKDAANHTIHQTAERFGFRTVEFYKGDGFYINGKKMRFKGSAYHTFWPSSGRTTSKDLIIKDINLMKDMNMNTVRATTYPHTEAFYEVCDSLGLFVISELGGWSHPYDTDVGRGLVKTTVTRDVNHPSIVIWSNGNHRAFNPDFEPMFYKWDIQNRRVLHNASKKEDLPKPANSSLPIIDTRYYPTWDKLTKRLNGKYPYLSMETLHALYDGGGAAGMQDYWNKVRSSRLGAGLIIWAYLDECVERTDKDGRLDCAGNRAPDGIVGPYRSKEGSFYALKEIWSPVHLFQDSITVGWNGLLPLENRYYFTNLSRLNFRWKLVDLPGPLDKPAKSQILARGNAISPNIAPQTSGSLKLDLPSNWQRADMLQLKATDPHGREIYKWSLPIEDSMNAPKQLTSKHNSFDIKEKSDGYILSSDHLQVHVSKITGYISKVVNDGHLYSLRGGPAISSPEGENNELKSLAMRDGALQAYFGRDSYRLRYSIEEGGLKVNYSYRPSGEISYYGIQFDYPEKKVSGVQWVGHGPGRVWKNRTKGMELGLWSKHRIPEDSLETSLSGYYWKNPYFSGFYAGLRWVRLQTSEGAVTVRSADHNVYLGLLNPQIPPDPKNTRFAYPKGNLSFLHDISPIGSKWQEARLHGPDSQMNSYNGKKLTNTLWFYFSK